MSEVANLFECLMCQAFLKLIHYREQMVQALLLASTVILYVSLLHDAVLVAQESRWNLGARGGHGFLW